MPNPVQTPNLWDTVKADFKSLFPEDVFHMWFEPVVSLETTDDVITLGVPNEFASIWIHDNYLDLITQRLRLVAGDADLRALSRCIAPAGVRHVSCCVGALNHQTGDPDACSILRCLC